MPKLSNIDLVLSLGTLVPQDAQRYNIKSLSAANYIWWKGFFSCNNKQLNYILLLNGIVDAISPLKEALKNASQPFFVEFAQFLNEEDFEILKNLIRYELTIHNIHTINILKN